MKQMVVKDTKLKTGGVIVVILSEKDAADMDVHNSDRIKICYKSREVNAIVDIYSGNVKPGIIGMVYELLDALKVKNGDIVKVMPSKRPLSLHYIKRKLDGHRLKKKRDKDHHSRHCL